MTNLIKTAFEASEKFNDLELVVEGESKVVKRYNNFAAIKLKPTIYSFTHNRAGIVEESETPRLRCSKVFANLLSDYKIKHAYQYVDIENKVILSDLINKPPPIEVIVKAFHSGTSKHRYYGMDKYKVRDSHSFAAGSEFVNEGPYPNPIVRFDWRNPLRDSNNKNLADEILPDSVADWFIDTKKAKITALAVFDCMSDFLSSRDIVIYDLCLFITEDGETVFGEISPDCGRFRHFDYGSLDKDVWRAGGSSKDVLEKWNLMASLIEQHS